MSQEFASYAALLQLALAATFLIIPIVAYRAGAKAQRAAEAEVVKQGFPADILARNRVRFAESGVEALLPLAIAGALATLGYLNLAGNDVGRIYSLIFQPLLLVAGSLITIGQVFPVRSIESAFKKSSDPALRRIDVGAFVAAARGAFPAWLPALIFARFLLVTVGSVAVIVLLALPWINPFLR
jgi:hypothetical protein